MKTSIGSLAALAAVIAVPGLVDAAPVPASLSNLSFPNGTADYEGDIDGDGISDFTLRVFANSYPNFSLTTAEVSLFSSPFLQGDTVTPFGPDTDSAIFHPGDGLYAGLIFKREAETHTAWLRFILNEGAIVLADGAWETESGAGIVVGAIPEPGAAAALAGGASLLFATSRRRRGSGAGSRAST